MTQAERKAVSRHRRKLGFETLPRNCRTRVYTPGEWVRKLVIDRKSRRVVGRLDTPLIGTLKADVRGNAGWLHMRPYPLHRPRPRRALHGFSAGFPCLCPIGPKAPERFKCVEDSRHGPDLVKIARRQSIDVGPAKVRKFAQHVGRPCTHAQRLARRARLGWDGILRRRPRQPWHWQYRVAELAHLRAMTSGGRSVPAMIDDPELWYDEGHSTFTRSMNGGREYTTRVPVTDAEIEKWDDPAWIRRNFKTRQTRRLTERGTSAICPGAMAAQRALREAGGVPLAPRMGASECMIARHLTGEPDAVRDKVQTSRWRLSSKAALALAA
jgi:hypothetical protein